MLKKVWSVLVFCLGLVLVLGSNMSWAQESSSVSVQILPIIPDLAMLELSDTSLQVTWDWGMPGYVPSLVTEVRVELSVDGINFSNLQIHDPDDFEATYNGLGAGIYSARVTVVDPDNFDYSVGFVDILGADGGRRRVNPGDGGGTSSGGTEHGSSQPGAGEAQVVIRGLAYPGPYAEILVKYGEVEELWYPGGDGRFEKQISGLEVGQFDISLQARDPHDNLSLAQELSRTLEGAAVQYISNVNFEPTIWICDSDIAVGTMLELRGYAYPGGRVTVNLSGSRVYQFRTVAGNNGYWAISVNTADLMVGRYMVAAQAVSAAGTVTSPVSRTVYFDLEPVPNYGMEVNWNWDHVSTGYVPSEVREVRVRISSNGIEYSNEQVHAPGDFQAVYQNLERGTYTALIRIVGEEESEYLVGPMEVGLREEVDACPGEDSETGDVETGGRGAVGTGTVYIDIGDVELSEGTTGGDGGGFPGFSNLPPAPVIPDLPPLVMPTFCEDLEIDTQGMQELSVNLKYLPEARVPEQGNFSTRVCVDVLRVNSGVVVNRQEYVTNGNGLVNTDLFVPRTGESYDLRVKGFSHLSVFLKGRSFSGNGPEEIDVSLGNTIRALAGDVNIDDVVNALDISVINSVLDESDQRSDQNADGIVNALDLSITIKNLDKVGGEVLSISSNP